VASAARTAGTAASPMTKNAAEIPARPGKIRIPRHPYEIWLMTPITGRITVQE
jgi:hypothetical protein